MFRGDLLQHRMDSAEGALICIPADKPHVPVSVGAGPTTAIIARSDPNRQDCVTLLPDLVPLVP